MEQLYQKDGFVDFLCPNTQGRALYISHQQKTLLPSGMIKGILFVS